MAEMNLPTTSRRTAYPSPGASPSSANYPYPEGHLPHRLPPDCGQDHIVERQKYEARGCAGHLLVESRGVQQT